MCSRLGVIARPGQCGHWGSTWNRAQWTFRSQRCFCNLAVYPWPLLTISFMRAGPSWARLYLQMWAVLIHFTAWFAPTPSHAPSCLTLHGSLHFTDLDTEAQRGEGTTPAHIGNVEWGSLTWQAGTLLSVSSFSSLRLIPCWAVVLFRLNIG